ncbi:peptidyl-tRNA hydrolase II domain-containing protein [Papiliotrema laurentii]|uniref:peptidyl-tRNA hydrolase n=1 Tax=Papiliotrema laurentii TaxID=5418 RepID=A0AAD9D0L8_PAPLA|nr:peptidyl-tRNA hydrolase II domain-containing protein [Papiliotrema laurentii]
MQIILPKSLVTQHGWPVGPLMAQSAHASTAVIHENYHRPEVQEYLCHLQSMRKTVLEVPDEAALKDLASKLDTLEPKIPYHLWIEQPENTPTALALMPNKRPKALKSLLEKSGCQLWR